MRRSIITLGTFDGVHRGHRALIKKVLKQAKRFKAQSVVLAFGLPPRHVQDGPTSRNLLTTVAEKIEILKSEGVERIQILKFDRRTANTLPEEFFLREIVHKNRAQAMVVGPRVAFGKDRVGKLPLLLRLGKRYSVRIEVVRSVHGHSGVVASRRIRALLALGRTAGASGLLGYPYSVAGRVVHGDHRGRQLGFPTANLEADAGKILPKGVFWVKVLPGSAPMPLTRGEASRGIDGLCNIGTRPTFHPRAQDLQFEVYLFKQKGSFYGRKFRVVFMRKIRSEKRFSSKQALISQIQHDFTVAQKWAFNLALQEKPFSI